MCKQVFPEKEIYTPLINCKTIDQMIDKLNKAIIDGREL
jgi:hypothetical protein